MNGMTGSAQVVRRVRPMSANPPVHSDVLRVIHRSISSRGGGYKSTSKPNEEDVEVCTQIRGLVFDADYFQELHSRASLGFFQGHQNPDVNKKWIRMLLRAKGWIVLNYELAPNLSDTIDIPRVAVRQSAEC